MGKSIASKTLAIAKKRETERLAAVKEQFLEIIRKEFDKKLISYEPWEAVGSTFYTYEKTFDKFASDDLASVCEDIGFNLRHNCSDGSYSLSIPEWIPGNKRTQAQLMLYWFNLKLNKNIKLKKDLARKMCRKALEKIENGDFLESTAGTGYYITVEMLHSEDNQAFKDEITRFFSKKHFYFIGIEVKNIDYDYWIFVISGK